MAYWLLLILSATLPLQIALNPAAGFDLASGRLFVLVIFILWLIAGLACGRLHLSAAPQSVILLSFIFLCGLSLFSATNHDWAWRKLIFLLSFAPLFWITADFARIPEKRRRLADYLTYGAGLGALLGITQFSLQFTWGLEPMLRFWEGISPAIIGKEFSRTVLEHSSWLVNIGGRDYFRAIGFFPDPHMFAMYLGLLWPFSANSTIEAWRQRDRGRLLFSATNSLLIISAIALTFSRGAYLSVLAGILFLFWLWRKQLPATVGNLAILPITALLIIFLISNPIAERLKSSFDTAEGSNTERLENWKQAIEIITDHPLTGIGLGNYSLNVLPIVEYRNPIYSHNTYLDIAAETGLSNMLFFSVFLLIVLINFLKMSRQDLFWSAGSASILIFAIHSFFETGLYSVHVMPVLLMLGALSIKSRI